MKNLFGFGGGGGEGGEEAQPQSTGLPGSVTEVERKMDNTVTQSTLNNSSANNNVTNNQFNQSNGSDSTASNVTNVTIGTIYSSSRDLTTDLKRLAEGGA